MQVALMVCSALLCGSQMCMLMCCGHRTVLLSCECITTLGVQTGIWTGRLEWSRMDNKIFVSALECRDIVLEAYIRRIYIRAWYILFAMHMCE